MDRALIASAGQSSNEYLARHLNALGYSRPTIVASGGEARRLVDKNQYSLVIINAPLPDEFGHELAIYMAEKTLSGVLLLAKPGVIDEVSDRIADRGVLILQKPFGGPEFDQLVRLAASTHLRLLNVQAECVRLQERLQQLRLVDRAKCYLIEKRGMTEADAHRYIEKRAMDTRRNRGEVAQSILEEGEQGG